MDLTELFEFYYDLKISASNRSEITKLKYKKLFTTILKNFGNIDIYSIKPSYYQMKMNQIGKSCGSDHLRRINRLFKKMILFYQLDGHDDLKDFTRGYEVFSKIPSKHRQDKFIHSLDDYHRVLESCQSRFNYDYSVSYYYLYLLFSTGLRPSELLALTWSSINFKHSTLKVGNRISTVTLVRSGPKNMASDREIPVNTECVKVLSELKQKQRAMLSSHNMQNKEDLVFYHWNYKNMLPINATLRKSLFIVLDDLEIPRISLYGARHTRLSVLMNSPDLSLEVISKYAGYTDINMLISIYGGVLTKKQEEEFEIIQQI